MGKLIIINNGNNIDLSLITATSNDILSGKIGIDNKGNKIIGTIQSQPGSTVTPGTSNKTVIPSGKYTTGNIIVQGDADLIAANIKKGKNIFNVAGTCNEYKQYYNSTPIPSASGRKTFNCAFHGTETLYYVNVKNLGFIPKVVICASDGSWRDITVSAGWGGIFAYSSSSSSFHQFALSELGWTTSNIDIPVYKSGNHWVYVAGYV